jgi:FlaA1/EpsC-like NDP-sugar epimerase
LAAGLTPFQTVPLLADILDAVRIAAIMADHEISVVLHAAAYKHVRMVQENAKAGILNNVWGTKNVAEAASAQGVKLFILVSTDKAVRPTSVMGASKRLAEMVIQALAKQGKNRTVFAMVRFGNVLGSTGSVVPLFREQITAGGPVQVTHPDVTRFFMLIPEAAQLVIQAGAMAERGEVFVLDMGESVKIVSLAETMIELAGMTRRTPENPDGDIEIVFSGLRDGEKLYEELQIGRDVSNTSNPRIMRSNEYYLPQSELVKKLAILKRLLDAEKTKEATALLMELAHAGS